MLGGNTTDTSEVKTSHEDAGLLPLIALLSQPVLLASGIITMRKMRRLPETCASTYCNMSLFLLSFGVMVAMEVEFSFILNFSVQTWIMIVLSCTFTIMAQITKAIAFKYQPASKLQNLAFVPNLWQFMIDVTLIGVGYGVWQIMGFALLFIFYGGNVLRFYMKQRKLNRARKIEANNDENFVQV